MSQWTWNFTTPSFFIPFIHLYSCFSFFLYLSHWRSPCQLSHIHASHYESYHSFDAQMIDSDNVLLVLESWSRIWHLVYERLMLETYSLWCFWVDRAFSTRKFTFLERKATENERSLSSSQSFVRMNIHIDSSILTENQDMNHYLELSRRFYVAAAHPVAHPSWLSYSNMANLWI